MTQLLSLLHDELPIEEIKYLQDMSLNTCKRLQIWRTMVLVERQKSVMNISSLLLQTEPPTKKRIRTMILTTPAAVQDFQLGPINSYLWQLSSSLPSFLLDTMVASSSLELVAFFTLSV